MDIIFRVIDKGAPKEFVCGENIGFLEKDDWDDYSFRTSFNLTIFDAQENKYDLGHIKIGFKDQIVPSRSVSYTFKSMSEVFSKVAPEMFSLGQDVSYYEALVSMNEELRESILRGLNDVAFDLNTLEKVKGESVFMDSFLRTVTLDEITERFNRMLDGFPALTPFNFAFSKKLPIANSSLSLKFKTKPSSYPPSNTHVLIGRNGAGKTTILNSMISTLLSKDHENFGRFYTENSSKEKSDLPEDYFPNVVLVSFSAFDSFEFPEAYNEELQKKPPEEIKPNFSYIGLKEDLAPAQQSQLKNKEKLSAEFIASLKQCFRFSHTKTMWLKAMKRLKSDDNFSEMKLESYATEGVGVTKSISAVQDLFMNMSSGHAIVLLTITKLIMEVGQRSLILIDEPEGHLHPPLLAAFMHSLSDLLIRRNGIAIIATHSPVVLQEVSQKCVWNIIRYDGGLIRPQKLDIESYGENVGVLTREVFGLEVKESGFHKVLAELVKGGEDYDGVLKLYGESLGLEARSMLKALTFKRDKRKVNAQT